MKYVIKFKNKKDDIETEIVAKRLKNVPYHILVAMSLLCTLDELLKNEAIDKEHLANMLITMCCKENEERHEMISDVFAGFRELGLLDDFFKDNEEEK